MKSALLFLSAMIVSLFAEGQITINEFIASNSLGIEDVEFFNNSDWVELHNAGPEAIDVSGWHLTDNVSDTMKWTLPSGSNIPAGAFLLVWCDGENSGFHTSFKLSRAGEELGLYNSDLALIDSFIFEEQFTDISRGRSQDGSGDWAWFNAPTPGTSNSTSISYEAVVHQIPHFSTVGGFFEMPFNLELSSLSGTIRYTLDGREPTLNDLAYVGSISIETTTFVRARVFLDNQVPGPIGTQSYFFEPSFADRPLPIFSLVTDPDYFWDADTGIYVQDFKPDWEWPLNVEFFENDGNNEAAFNERAGVKINGQNSWVLPQKMLGIYFRGGYGAGSLDYPLFHDRDRSQFDDFVLRASGSDWAYTLMRDGIGQSLPQDNAPVGFQGFRPSIVFINGEYMGIHNIRSRVDEGFIENNYNLNSGTYDLITDDGQIEEGDGAAYVLMDALMNEDLSVPSNFDAAAAVMDFQGFADYWATEIWSSNSSWGHNVVLTKPTDSGRWRFIFTDLDRGFSGSTNDDIGEFTGAQNDNYDYARNWIRHALENTDYAALFAQRFTDHLHTSFHPQRVNSVIQAFVDRIETEIPYHVERWAGTTSSYGDGIESEEFWEEEVEKLRLFASERSPHMLQNLADEFNLEPSVNLRTDNLPSGAGTIRLNTFEIPGSPWNGAYFPDMPFELTAQPLPGQQFIGWSQMESSLLIPAGSTWSFLDNGNSPPTDWTSWAFDDADWQSGEAELGYGDGDEATMVSYGSNANDKHIATYFRHSFNLDSDEAQSLSALFQLKRDDGAVVYLNGEELFRSNMPTGPIDFETTALDVAGGDAESNWNDFSSEIELNPGVNTIAVEIHQFSSTSSDISFDLSLSVLTASDDVFSSENPLSVNLSESSGFAARYTPNGACTLPMEISEDLTLELSCSPYLAIGNTHVLPNVTLTIEPGVEVLFPTDVSLIIEGKLHAEGSAMEPIRFGLNPDYEGPWGQLKFQESTSPNLIRHAIVESASDGPHPVHDRAAIAVWFSDLTLDHVELTDNYSNPVYSEYGQMVLTNSTLHSDITGDLINVRHGSGFIDSCIFIGNDAPDTDAIDYDQVVGGSILHCTIHSFHGENSDGIDLGEESESILIEGGLIHHCTDKGISIGQASNATIRNMTIAHCALGVALKDQGAADLDHVTLYGNQTAVSAYEKNVGRGGGWGTVQNTLLSNSSDAPFTSDSLSSILVMNSTCDTDSLEDPEVNWANPLFADPDGFDFTLLENSPALGAANDGLDLGTLNHWPSSQRNVTIVEIGYAGIENPNKEWIRLFNPSAESVDMIGYTLSDAIQWTLNEAFVLEPGASLWVVRDGSFFEDSQDAVFQWQTGQLANEGERIVLSNAAGMVMDFVRYAPEAPWPVPQAGAETLHLVSSLVDNHFASSWTLGALQNEDEVSSSAGFRVYPNPANQWINVTSDRPIHSCTLFNITGQSLAIPWQGRGMTRANMDVSSLYPGLYIVRVNETSLPFMVHH